MNPWSLFWRQGHSTTFGEYFKQGYEGAVGDWWLESFKEAPADGTVLEVGCGNGSLLPVMAKAGLSGRYVGVDIASVKPSEAAEAAVAESGIELVIHPETPAEEIPEADDSVDVVASVFGIEYSDLARSLPEAARVLKKNGQFLALLHHDGSVVTRMSKRALSEFDNADLALVIESLSAISSERDRVNDLAELKNSSRAERARVRINTLAQKYLNDTNPQTANATMFEIMKNALVFFKMMGAESGQRQSFIQTLEAEQRASHERFGQMVSVALDDEGVEDFRKRLTDAGFRKVKIDVLRNGEDILAWAVVARR